MKFIRSLITLLVFAAVCYGTYRLLFGGGKDPDAAAGGPAGGFEMPAPTVDTAQVTTETIDIVVETVGSVRAKEEVKVTSKVAGIVKSIHFADGQHVEAGQLLAELESAERSAELRESMTRREDAQREVDRSRSLAQTSAISKQEFDKLLAELDAAAEVVRAAEARLKDLEVRTPFAGVLGFRAVSLGSLVIPGVEVTTLRSVNPIEVEFNVPELHAGNLRTSVPVEVTSVAYPDRVFRGEVSAVDPAVDSVSRTVPVKGLFPNPDEALKPGLFVNVTLSVGRRENAVVIPEDAILHQGDRKLSYVVENGKAVRRDLVLGVRRRGDVEVLKGLTAGEVVMLTGLQNARDGMEVVARPAGAKPGPGADTATTGTQGHPATAAGATTAAVEAAGQ